VTLGFGRPSWFSFIAAGLLGLALPASAQIDPRLIAAGQAAQGGQGSAGAPVTGGGPAAGVDAQNPFIVTQSLPVTRLEDRGYDRLLGREPPSAVASLPPAALTAPGEFELQVERLLGRRLRRFGDDLLLPSGRDFAAPATATVPPDYVIQPGDVIELASAGPLQGSTRLEVDTNGRVFVPGVGPVMLAGVRHADLQSRLRAAIGTRYRNVAVNVAVRELRGIRAYVTGFAARPGAFSLSSLSTVANAILQAGGPASGGSFRAVSVYRNSREIGRFDLYTLLRGGRSIGDIVLQNDDVLFIPPAGAQVAVIGSVQSEAIYELLPGETVADVVRLAGGPNSLADTGRAVVYHSGDAQAAGPQEIAMANAGSVLLRGGDIVQLLSQGSLTSPTDRQAVLVRVDGEVRRPGNYYLPSGSSMAQVLETAGGLTERAYPFAARFTRQAVRAQQRQNLDEALRQMELALASAPLTQPTGLGEGDRQSQLNGARATLEQLRKADPDGRVVLDLPPESASLPGDIVLENNDALYVPPRSSVVGVYGAVFRPSTFLIDPGTPLRVRDVIERAGGSVRAADHKHTILIRANGATLSRRRHALDATVLPGDVIFVPVRTQGNMFWARFKDIATTLFGLGLTTATIAAAAR
jgi:polysaccharide biosynthesis/export protein